MCYFKIELFVCAWFQSVRMCVFYCEKKSIKRCVSRDWSHKLKGFGILITYNHLDILGIV